MGQPTRMPPQQLASEWRKGCLTCTRRCKPCGTAGTAGAAGTAPHLHLDFAALKHQQLANAAAGQVFEGGGAAGRHPRRRGRRGAALARACSAGLRRLLGRHGEQGGQLEEHQPPIILLLVLQKIELIKHWLVALLQRADRCEAGQEAGGRQRQGFEVGGWLGGQGRDVLVQERQAGKGPSHHSTANPSPARLTARLLRPACCPAGQPQPSNRQLQRLLTGTSARSGGMTLAGSSGSLASASPSCLQGSSTRQYRKVQRR
jgi:hypothetical protein